MGKVKRAVSRSKSVPKAKAPKDSTKNNKEINSKVSKRARSRSAALGKKSRARSKTSKIAKSKSRKGEAGSLVTAYAN